jgi:hypothetical protein
MLPPLLNGLTPNLQEMGAVLASDMGDGPGAAGRGLMFRKLHG